MNALESTSEKLIFNSLLEHFYEISMLTQWNFNRHSIWNVYMLWKEHDMKSSLFIAMKCTNESAVDDKQWNYMELQSNHENVKIPWIVQTNCSILWNSHRQFNHHQLQLAPRHFITYIPSQFIIKWHGYVQNSVFILWMSLIFIWCLSFRCFT